MDAARHQGGISAQHSVSEVAGSFNPFLALGQGLSASYTRLASRQILATHSNNTVHPQRSHFKISQRGQSSCLRNLIARDAEGAVRVAEKFGYPVVVKPLAADFGRGVSTGNENPDQVRSAFVNAATMDLSLWKSK